MTTKRIFHALTNGNSTKFYRYNILDDQRGYWSVSSIPTLLGGGATMESTRLYMPDVPEDANIVKVELKIIKK